MSEISLKAEIRKGRGKGYNNRIRENGLVPGIIYGKGTDGAKIQLNEKEIAHILSSETGRNTIITINIPGFNENDKVMVRDVQKDPVKGFIKHIDFYQISLKERISTNVPLRLIGEARGIKEGGILQQGIREIEIECLPGEIPETIDVDIARLNIGDNLTVSEIKAKDEFEIITEPSMVVVSVLAPKIVEEEQVEKEGITAETTEAKREKELVTV